MRRNARLPAKPAEKLLQRGGNPMKLLREHPFKSDEALHDDELHRKLRAESSAEVERASELESFGVIS